MPDPVPPITKPPTTVHGAELPPRLLAKLKIEVEGYELLERIGEGGQASVYKAVQRKDGATVAIKILHAGPHATDEARARLKRETAALRALNHPNIVHAIAAGRTRSGLDCLVMNYIDGRPLDALWEDDAFAAAVTPEPPPPPAARLRLFKQICETVQAAHRKGITHRDLSPSNILIDTTGQPHILDFGMASTAFDGIVGRNVTVTGQFIGKLKYASPEQARGANTKGTPDGDVDIRSDVYALGVMLYQLLTNGAFPYEVVGNVIDVLNNIIHSKPRPPSEAFSGAGVPPAVPGRPAPAPVRRNPPLVNETIEAIVLKALEKEPEKRYQSAGELAADIDRYLAGQPTSATVWSKRPKPASKFSIRRRPILAAASLILVATLVGVTMNARTLAVWLGLSTVVAPILPISPVAPMTANATLLDAAQPEGGIAGLKRLAEDVARAEARLLAVNRELNNRDSKIESPELKHSANPPAAPLPYEEFVAKLCEIAGAAGKPLVIDVISKEEYDQFFKEESDRLPRDADNEALLAQRQTLDSEQAALWTRISCEVFADREVGTQLIYTVRLKPVLPADTGPDAAMAAVRKGEVLGGGVKAVRSIDAALKEASTALKPRNGPEATSVDTAAAARTSVARIDDAINALRRSANSTTDTPALSEAEKEASRQLGKIADEVRASLQNVADEFDRATKAQTEIERSRRRAAVQSQLLAAIDSAARLDHALVVTAKEWKAEYTSDKLGPVIAKAKPNVQNPTPKRESVSRGTLPEGSSWTGRITVFVNGKRRDSSALTVTVTKRDGDRVHLDWEMPDYGGQVSIEGAIVGNKLTGLYTKLIKGSSSGDIIGNATVAGILQGDGKRITNGVYEVPGSNPKRTGTWELQRKDAGANADPELNRGDTLKGQLAIAADTYPATATVQQLTDRSAIVRVDNGLAVWDYTLGLQGDSAKVTDMNRVSTNTGNQISNWDISGKVTADGIELSGYWSLKPPKGAVVRQNVQLMLTKKQ